jgi:hypothetical protein
MLEDYVSKRNQRLKIVTTIRNPNQRLLSSFFQQFHSDEKTFKHKMDNETTVSNLSESRLLILFMNILKTYKLNGMIESLDEMSSIFEINIIDQLEKKRHYYTFNNSLIELIVLDFDKLISNNHIEYINNCFGSNFAVDSLDNLSSNKSYFQKYLFAKSSIEDITNVTIKRFNHFYFDAFSSDN